MSNLTAEQLIEQAHVWLMGEAQTVAYASVIMVGETRIDDDCPTACTNGRDVIYGREFIKSLEKNKPCIRGVVLHENLHKIYQHGWLWKDLMRENPERANMAMDYVINLEIDRIRIATNEKVKLPEGCLLDYAYKGMSTPEVYRLLESNGGGGGGGGGGKKGKLLDQHDFGKISPEDVKQAAEEIDAALRQGALAASKLGGNVSRNLTALLEPKINWREQLRDFITSIGTGRDDSTWRKPNRRYVQYDMYMPSPISRQVGRIVFGGDTSGSISDSDIAATLTELVSICETVNPELLDVIWWDDAVCGHEVYQRDALHTVAQCTRPKGGGGTSAQCVSEYLKQNNLTPECVVMLSDGYISPGEWGQWNCPVLWVLTTKGITAPCGSTIHLEV